MNTDGGSGLRQKSNSAKLYLHVGPPKTATTSLQFALQSGNGPFVYMGVTQPRGIKEQENSALLHNAIAGKFVNVESVESVLGRIRQAINTDNNVVISDEMFLVDGLVNHQVKLARLSESLNDIPVVLIISLRNPTDGLPSLYQELYRNLPLRHQLSFKAFTKSNQAKVFDYQHLTDILGVLFSEIKILSFEKLVDGRVMLSDIFGSESSNDQPIIVQRVNVGHQGGNGRVVAPIKMNRFLRFVNLIPARLKNRLKSIRWIQRLWDKVREISVMPMSTRRLTVPSDLADDLRKKWIEIRDGAN